MKKFVCNKIVAIQASILHRTSTHLIFKDFVTKVFWYHRASRKIKNVPFVEQEIL